MSHIGITSSAPGLPPKMTMVPPSRTASMASFTVAAFTTVRITASTHAPLARGLAEGRHVVLARNAACSGTPGYRHADPLAPHVGGDDPDRPVAEQRHEEDADRARPDDEAGVALGEAHPVQRAEAAGHGLHEDGAAIGHVIGNGEDRIGDMQCRHADQFGEAAGLDVGALEQRVHRLAAAPGKMRGIVRRVMGQRNALAGLEAVTPSPSSCTTPTTSWPSFCGLG